jgi:glutamate decarboxylase
LQEKEVEDLMTEAFSKNFIDYEEYPQSADIQNRCVSMIARLYNAPLGENDDAAVGTSTVGSSEAIMLAVLAMKKKWKKARQVSKTSTRGARKVQTVTILTILRLLESQPIIQIS